MHAVEGFLHAFGSVIPAFPLHVFSAAVPLHGYCAVTRTSSHAILSAGAKAAYAGDIPGILPLADSCYFALLIYHMPSDRVLAEPR